MITPTDNKHKMSSSRSVRFRWPPVPCVEEEPASLARELHGLSKLSEKPGVEGTCRRGTVDQYPVILAPDSPLPTPTTPPSDLATPGLGNVSSDDSSSGPRTPSPQVPEPAVRSRAQSNDPLRLPPPSVSSRSRSRAPQAPQQLPVPDQQPARQRRPQSPSRDRDSGRREVGYFPPNTTRGLPTQQGPQDRGFNLTNQLASQAPASSPLGRSNSVRTGNSTAPTASTRQRSEPNSGYQSDSSTARGRLSSHVTSPPVSTSSSQMQVKRSSDAPTLSERIEEKLRLRHELRELGSDSDSEAPRRSRAKSISPKILPVAPAPEAYPPPRELSRAPGQHSMPPTREPIKVLITPQEPKQLPPATRGGRLQWSHLCRQHCGLHQGPPQPWLGGPCHRMRPKPALADLAGQTLSSFRIHCHGTAHPHRHLPRKRAPHSGQQDYV